MPVYLAPNLNALNSLSYFSDFDAPSNGIIFFSVSSNLIILFSIALFVVGLSTGYVFYIYFVCVEAIDLLSVGLTVLGTSIGLFVGGAVSFGAVSIGTYLAFFLGGI
jgi:hypothetical protein